MTIQHVHDDDCADVCAELKRAVEVGGDCRVPFAAPDLPASTTEHACPGARPIGDLDDAIRAIGATALAPPPDEGDPVGVVVIDTALSGRKEWAPGDAALKRIRTPELDKDTSHAGRILRLIRQIAGNDDNQVRCYLVPALPEPWSLEPNTWLSTMVDACRTLKQEIAIERAGDDSPRNWLLVNAWAVHDYRWDLPFGTPESYRGNPDHPVHQSIRDLSGDGIDIVFAAGNCGQFCPSIRCGSNDRGPDVSLGGANGHPDVLTVGAVQVNDTWLGYSSQGPARWLDRAREGGSAWIAKPDICAPSHFANADEGGRVATGTSTACALAAGAVALIRRTHPARHVPPTRLREVLRESARPVAPSHPNERTGFGVLDCTEALSRLP